MLFVFEPVTQLLSLSIMASQAKRSDVFQAAFAAAFNDRKDVVGGPGAQRRPEPGEFLAEKVERAVTSRVSQNSAGPLTGFQLCLLHQCTEDSFNFVTIHRADGANSVVTLKDLFTQVGGR